MQTPDQHSGSNAPGIHEEGGSKASQEKSDPQMTELKGFVKKDEDLEPTLTDGTKSPDKEPYPDNE